MVVWLVRGLHFLAVQPDPDSEELNGLWLLQVGKGCGGVGWWRGKVRVFNGWVVEVTDSLRRGGAAGGRAGAPELGGRPGAGGEQRQRRHAGR